ncbi:MAG: tyrosine--tRNA ligase [Flavobacteriales bacterium]|nr:tyrosine--tRNA ligase [Crocinitomicaceae bacterium]NBX79755.1 tyrosine--tRNA ligase [Flavobacteriales bacterium]NCA19918.1 tyrosine--tRNA ligase [Crocinitomicaceae bacterium]
MPTNFIEELTWRGMIHDIMPGTEEALLKQRSSGYIGFDPTADSLHVGHLVQIMTLVHFQRAGHKPFALVGGATGMVGDPSGKSQERNLLDAETLNHNVACVKSQLEKFLDFSGENAAEMVNNYDWFQNMSFLDFIRDVGKHITVNYMLSKDSVKKRLETGMSFTEFSYQLVQGYDFYHLNLHHNCIVQMGGSDQWGNIVTGTELIRRKSGGEAYAVTTPLIKKADGTKFGKTEGGSVWLDPEKTSPYQFYQFWLNSSDADSVNYIRIFTLRSQEEIEALEAEHNEAPHLRILQKAIAEDITTRVHGAEALKAAIAASNILFGKSTSDDLKSLSEKDFFSVFEGVPQATISREEFGEGISIVEAMAGKTNFLASNGEARRELKANAIAVNKEKVTESFVITAEHLINDKYVLLGKGKKNNYILVVE